ncbi:hypothetical protein OR1_01878 [Geobacter sp. OR-1]|uniref:hypothetical protein n=1 Tax=Geobacter sp. OR-1 TaxID=1266765 RepID=UPI0005420905|nr:hypothetical protein [Geobacter sp. OR-1]GAM09598.1 hypothetical protein OR1_01878 [Geobacter sp. OR-1]
MKRSEYERVCYTTEQRGEKVPLKNLRNGMVGYSFGCTYEGETVQVRLEDGGLDSWAKDDCVEEK